MTQAQSVADGLLTATRAGELDQVARLLGEVASGDASARLEVLRGLVHRCAAAVAERFGPQSPDEVVFTAGVVDQKNGAVEIDVLEPSARAALRAVLAELNGDPVGLQAQLEFAARDNGLPAMVCSLVWTVEFD